MAEPLSNFNANAQTQHNDPQHTHTRWRREIYSLHAHKSTSAHRHNSELCLLHLNVHGSAGTKDPQLLFPENKENNEQ